MSEEYAVRKGEFSWALEVLKQGKRVARRGWNGQGMWLFHVPHPPSVTGADGDGYSCQDWIGMKTAQGTAVPWLCSQTDMLAEDWEEYGQAPLDGID